MHPTSRVSYQGNNAGILTTRNPLAWERGSPLGMNSRPRDAEDQIVFDSLDEIVGLSDLGALNIPNPFQAIGQGVGQAVGVVVAPFKWGAVGAGVGGIVGGIIGWKAGSTGLGALAGIVIGGVIGFTQAGKIEGMGKKK